MVVRRLPSRGTTRCRLLQGGLTGLALPAVAQPARTAGPPAPIIDVLGRTIAAAPPVRRVILGELVTHLNGLDARGMLIVDHNWVSRLVQDAPRAVYISDILQSKIGKSNHKQAFDRIDSDTKQGKSLVKYLISIGVGEDSRVCAIGHDVIRFGKPEVCHVEGRGTARGF